MDDKEYIADLIRKAKAAQQEFDEKFGQQEVDRIARGIAKVVFDGAEKWARMAVDETGMGRYEDKVQKKRNKARLLWNSLRDKKSMGIISRNEETGIVEIAKPVGVVGAVQPATNPIVTPMANVISALKGKNAIIISPHPRAVHCTAEIVKEWRAVLKKCNAPENLIQSVEDSTIERTAELMRSVDVIVATGGPGMVKAAYSSGKPSYGVGAGNIQCIVDRGVDLNEAAQKIVYSRVFDYGIICSGDQGLIVPTELYQDFLKALEAQKTYIVKDPQEKERLTAVLFPEGKSNTKMVGQPVTKIAQVAGISVPSDTVMLAVPVSSDDLKNPLRREKMFPVAIVLTYETFQQALEIMKYNLSLEGKGHSVCIHSHDTEHIEKLGLAAPASRVIVNAPSTVSTGGNFYNGLAPTSTLGCGTWGNNSISENLTYKHLLNITRIAYPLTNPKIPTDEELFGGEI